MKEQKLKRVTQSDRRKIVLAVSQNKRSRKWQEAKLDSQFGPHTCGHCRAEPCGAMWPHSACCHRCTHLPMPRWQLSHVLWYRQKPYYVMEVAARRPGAGVEQRFRSSEGAGSAPRKELVPRLQKASGSAASESSWSGSGSGPASTASGTSEHSERNQRRRRGTSDFRGAEPLLSEEQLFGVQVSPVAGASATDAIYYRWDGVAQWVRRARTHYFLGVRVSPAEFLRSVPNEEELAEFAPRERPPHPFESGISEQPEDEEGDDFLDRREPEPEDEDDGLKHYKKGLQFVEPEEDDDEQET